MTATVMCKYVCVGLPVCAACQYPIAYALLTKNIDLHVNNNTRTSW